MVPCSQKHSYLGLFFARKDEIMKIYLISGKAEHGKDTCGKFLKKYYELRGEKDYFGWDPLTEEKPRELLQKLGQEIIREKLNKPYFLIDRTSEDIEILAHFFDVFMITDVRLPIEIDTFKERFQDVVSLHVNRPGYVQKNLNADEKQHLTENALENYQGFDYIVQNTTLEKLDKEMESIVRKEEYKDEKNDEYRN